MSDRFNSMGAFSRTMAAPVRPTTSESAPTERGAGRQDEAITTGASKPISVDSRSLSRRALDGTAGFHAAEEISSEGFPPRLLGAIIGLALIIAIIGYLIESAPSKKELSDSLNSVPAAGRAAAPP